MQRLVLRQRGTAAVAREALLLRAAAPCRPQGSRPLSMHHEASPQPEDAAALPLAPPSSVPVPTLSAASSASASSHSAAAAPVPTKHATLSAEEQEEMYRQGGRELGRAWEREGGVRPALARFERVLHTNDLDQMGKAWKELRKDGMEFAHFQKFIGILLDDRHLSGWVNQDTARRRMRLAWSIYEHMLPLGLLAPDSPVLPHQKSKIYSALLKAFALVGDGWRANELAEHMEAAGFLPIEEAMSNMVVAMAKSRLRHAAQEQFDKARRRGIILSSAAKSFLISCLARAGDGRAAAGVLDAAVQEATLNDNPGEVSGNMVKKVLEVGIDTADVEVLRRGLGALSVPVDRGMGIQILNVAARHGDGQLAMDMFYAMESWGYAPSASAFNAVLQALALSRNDVAMLKALNEMCAWGLEPSEGTLHLIARQFSSSVSRLDDAYNNLVALRRAYEAAAVTTDATAATAVEQQQSQSTATTGGTPATAPALPVAAPAVYLIVLGCAYAKQLDRAFATFEDFGPVFGLRHDAPACNALLLACLRSRSLQVGAAFSVMTEMERLSVAPDAETCHLMVRILVQAKESDGDKMEQVLAFMERQGVQPRPDTLRLLALWHALTGDHDRAGEILSALQAQGAFIPSYFPLRLEQIRANRDRL